MPKIQPGYIKTLHWSQIREAHTRILGQKCARLADFKSALLLEPDLEVQVPAFYAITSNPIKQIINKETVSKKLQGDIDIRTRALEKETGKTFGSGPDPLILAVRSGDPISMVGTMTTILNVGMNDKTVPMLISIFGEKNAASFYRMYLDLIIDLNLYAGKVPREEMNHIFREMKQGLFKVTRIQELIREVQGFGYTFPQDVNEQLYEAVKAVALSWKTRVAQNFVKSFELSPELFPSVFIQEKSFASLRGRAFASFFTRNPLTGERQLSGDFALDTEGRFMMRGICLTRRDILSLKNYFPKVEPIINRLVSLLEERYKRPQDIEAIIQNNKLVVLQVVDTHLSYSAYSRVQKDMQTEGILGPEEHMPVMEEIHRTLVVKSYKIDPEANLTTIDTGLPASNGAIQGGLALSIRSALKLKRLGKPVILLLDSPDDRALELILRRQIDGLATTYASTHDEVAARASHMPAVMNFKGLVIEKKGIVNVAEGVHVTEGEELVLDGDNGTLMLPNGNNVLIENGVEIFNPHNIDGVAMYKVIRKEYGNASYEKLLAVHAKNVGTSKNLDDPVWKTRLELVTHFIHILIFEKAEELGIGIDQAYLDVAVADGNLERVPGFEKYDFTLDKEPDGNIYLIFETLVDYLGTDISHSAVPDAQAFSSSLNDRFKKLGMRSKIVAKSKKLSKHTNYIDTTGILITPQEFPQVLDIMKELL